MVFNNLIQLIKYLNKKNNKKGHSLDFLYVDFADFNI